MSATERSSPDPLEDGVQRKEVDYYLNPTELFRWINYRRWDGAKARVLSHAEECSTWIVSRHSNDGRVLWRHLPLHLVCMQSDSTDGMEDLVDILLEAYPDAASSPDDQGMLPLHLIVANSTKPNERVLNLLILCYPTGIDVKDKYGRTPMDLVKEKAENGPHRDAAIRALLRAKTTTQKLMQAIREENDDLIAAQQQTHANERMASQRIILRLEEELEASRKRTEEFQQASSSQTGTTKHLAQQLDHLQHQLESSHNTILSVRRERDELLHRTELLEAQVHEHDRVVAKLHQDFTHDRQDQSDVIANLKSEVSTSKAMAAALESQLKSRFTNEEYLTTAVSDLETKLSDLTLEHQQERKKLLHERDTYQAENTQLQRQVDELSKKFNLSQTKLATINKQMTSVLSSHGALNAEHDRIVEANLRVEADLLEHTRAERANMMLNIKKQWEFMEANLKQQEHLLAETEQKESEILSLARDERERSVEVMARMRQDFRDARSSALDRARGMPADSVNGGIMIDNNARPESRNGERPPQSSGASQHTDGRSNGSHNSRPSPSDNVGSLIPPTSSIQPTRRMSSRSDETISAYSSKNEEGHPARSFLYPGRNSSLVSGRTSQVESRSPSGDMSMERRQAAEQQQTDRNLLQLLEARAASDGRSRSLVSSNESSTFGTSSTVSSRHMPTTSTTATTSQPRLINMPRVNFDASTTSSSHTSTSPRNATSRSTATSYSPHHPPPKMVPSLSLDEYSHNQSVSSGSVDSDSDSSSTRGGGAPTSSSSRKSTTGSQYSGMVAGMRMGMIRIAEEESVESDADSRFTSNRQ